MTGPRPTFDADLVTQLSPDEWRTYLHKAMAALHENPKDQEALQAISDANMALGVYDQAAAASPGERIQAGVTGGLQGVAASAVDLGRGILNIPSAVAHPRRTLRQLAGIPGALRRGLSANATPEQAARTVGNIGGLLLPAAKLGKTAAPLRVAGVAAGPETTVGGLMGRAASAGARTARDVVGLPVNLAKKARATRLLQETRLGREPEMLAAKIAEEQARARYYNARAETMQQRIGNRLRTPEATAPSAASAATAEELAVAQRLGLPLEQVQGRVGEAAVARAKAAPRALSAEEQAAIEARRQAAQAPEPPRMTPIEQGRVTPVDEAAAASARQLIAEQQRAGLRGPRGGMRASMGPELRKTGLTLPRSVIVQLGERIKTLSTEELQQQLANPLVEDWVKEAVQQEIARRGIG